VRRLNLRPSSVHTTFSPGSVGARKVQSCLCAAEGVALSPGPTPHDRQPGSIRSVLCRCSGRWRLRLASSQPRRTRATVCSGAGAAAQRSRTDGLSRVTPSHATRAGRRGPSWAADRAGSDRGSAQLPPRTSGATALSRPFLLGSGLCADLASPKRAHRIRRGKSISLTIFADDFPMYI
jgi:hypothetical protein